jgi:hypothetical protein
MSILIGPSSKSMAPKSVNIAFFTSNSVAKAMQGSPIAKKDAEELTKPRLVR